MKRGAAEWRDGVGAGQRVDAAAVRIGIIGPDRFRNRHPATHAGKEPRMDAAGMRLPIPRRPA